MRPELLLLVFAATFGLCAIAGLAFDTERRRTRRAAMSRLRRRGEGGEEEEITLLRRAQRVSGIAALDRFLADRAITRDLLARLDRAGSQRAPGEFMLVTAVLTATAFTAGLYIVGPLVGAGLALGAVAAPYWVLGLVTKARVRRFEAQLPEALDALVNSLKAGYSFPAALDFAAGEIPAPLGPELARARDEQRLGVDVRTVLASLADRLGTTDARMLVTAVLLQRETGGNLAELLTNLAALVRERAQFRGHVRALTAEPRMSALVLALMPMAVLLMLMAVNPDYVRPMFASQMGRSILLFAGGASAVGYVVMRRLGNVEM
ncbi:MAG: type II secretion system F family protein [Gemmatirosa sp.]